MLAAHTTTLEANSYNHILPNLPLADIDAVCNIEKHYAYFVVC